MDSMLADEELSIDIQNLSRNQQSLIVSNASTVLKLLRRISGKENGLVQIEYSSVDPICIEKSIASNGRELSNHTLIYELPELGKVSEDQLDPHYVKNVRGAVLLSLAKDLIDVSIVKNTFTFFSVTSPITLHSASAFLYNQENAYLMWEVLKSWESTNDLNFMCEINRQIQLCKTSNRNASLLSQGLSKNESNETSHLMYLVQELQEKVELPQDIYSIDRYPQAWFVDDQIANGWEALLKGMLSKFNVELLTFISLQDMEYFIDSMANNNIGSVPDIAFVDLRLSSKDPTFETYDSPDLSGFKVVECLLSHWPGLPIIIASASNKLWNVEKALKKGATGYWRKSDEIHDAVDKTAIFTALAIHKQFIDKTALALQKAQFRHVFRITELLKNTSFRSPIRNTSLQRSIVRYCNDAPRKISLMLWQELDETETIDGLFLGVMELLNEVEPLLWEPNTRELVCVPNKRVQQLADGKAKPIIKDTLDYLNNKYAIKGKDLTSHYDDIKNVRNNLPFIHGSSADNSIKHANLGDLETVLILVWILVNELASI